MFLSVRSNVSLQRAMKVVSDIPGLVDFAIGLVYFGGKFTEGLLSILPIKKGFGAS